MKSQTELSHLLIALANIVESMPEEQFARLINGDESPASALPPHKAGAAKNKPRPRHLSASPQTVNSWNELTSKLRSAKTREEGVHILQHGFSTKEPLFEFAKFLDLPVQKGDSIARIRRKIVEFTVGIRLDGEAIRGGYSTKQQGRRVPDQQQSEVV